MPEAPPRATPAVVVAFDFGLRRIGVAQGNTLTRDAAALAALPNTDPGVPWPQLVELVARSGASQLVVGKPYNVDGSSHPLSAAADRFAAELARRCGLPVARVDERYSSLEANAELRAARAAGTRRRVRKEDIDSQAAAVILRRWLAGEGTTR
jgi:putative Holliday junction resolvase